jgi:hypothetical protein
MVVSGAEKDKLTGTKRGLAFPSTRLRGATSERPFDHVPRELSMEDMLLTFVDAAPLRRNTSVFLSMASTLGAEWYLSRQRYRRQAPPHTYSLVLLLGSRTDENHRSLNSLIDPHGRVVTGSAYVCTFWTMFSGKKMRHNVVELLDAHFVAYF